MLSYCQSEQGEEKPIGAKQLSHYVIVDNRLIFFNTPGMEHQPREQFSFRDAMHVTSIVDIGRVDPTLLQKVNRKNMDSILRKAVAGRLAVREEVHRDLDPEHPDDPSLEKVFCWFRPCVAQGHALQCSLNTASDVGFLRRLAMSDHATHPDTRTFTAYLDKMLEREKLLSRLFHIDVIRRLSEQKSEPELLQLAKEKWRSVIPELQNCIADETFDQQTAPLRNALEQQLQQGDNCMETDSFYDDVCIEFSKLVLADFRAHGEELQSAAQRMSAEKTQA